MSLAKSKKAQLGFHLFVFVFFMVVLAMLYSAFSQKTAAMQWKIGDRPAELLKAYQGQEKALQFVDYKSSYAAQQALYDLTREGIKDPYCGRYLGYAYWRGPKKDCYPLYPLQLSKLFRQLFNPYFNKDIPSEFHFPRGDNYNIILKDRGNKTEVIGIGAQNIHANASAAYKNVNYSWNYSVKPSFHTQLDHDISYYRDLIKYIKGTERVQGLVLNVTACQQTGRALKECIQEKLGEINTQPELKDKGWEISLGPESCDNKHERAYHSIVEAYESCLKSADDDCTCSIPKHSSIKKIAAGLGDYEEINIRLLKDGSNINIRLDREETIGKEPLLLNIIPDTQLCLIESDDDAIDFADITPQSPKSIVLYSDNSEIGKRVDGESNENYKSLKNFLYKQGSLLCQVGELGRKASQQYAGKKSCELQPQRSFKFCLNTSQKVFAYDRFENKKDFLPVMLRFALFFKDIIPPPQIDDLFAQDELKAEGSVLLNWTNTAKDTAKFIIFVQEVGGKPRNFPLHLKDITKEFEIEAIDLTKTQNMEGEGPLEYEFTIRGSKEFRELRDDRLYHTTGNDGFVYVLTGLEDNVEHDIWIVAEDGFGNKELDVNPANMRTVTPFDDLAPGKIVDLEIERTLTPGIVRLLWKKPITNLDGSPVTDLDEFRIYVKEDQQFFLISEGELNETMGLGDAGCDIEYDPLFPDTLNCEYELNLGAEAAGRTFYIGITALDDMLNEFEQLEPLLITI